MLCVYDEVMSVPTLNLLISLITSLSLLDISCCLYINIISTSVKLVDATVCHSIPRPDPPQTEQKSIRWSEPKLHSCFLELGLVLRPFGFLSNFFLLILSGCWPLEIIAGPNFTEIRPLCHSFWRNVKSTTYRAEAAAFQTLTTNDSAGSHFYNCVFTRITACVPPQHWITNSKSLQGAVGRHKKCYMQTYQFGIKYKYSDTPFPFIFS